MTGSTTGSTETGGSPRAAATEQTGGGLPAAGRHGAELSEDARLDAALSSLPELAGERTIRPLSGGITNRNYRVDTPRGSYVLRLGGARTEALGIDRAREHASTRAAEAAGVGAEVVAFLPEHGALVTRFVEGRVLSADDLLDPAVMRRVIESVRRCHEGPEISGRFSPFATVREYHALAEAGGVRFPPTLPGALSLLACVERALGAGEAPRPCHNVLLPANLIDDGERVRIIDWEYAAMGDRCFDLGNLAVNSKLSEEGERALLELYFGEVRPEDVRRLRLMRLCSDMRECLWGFLQAGISTIDFDFMEYGRAHLSRFLIAIGGLDARLLEPPAG